MGRGTLLCCGSECLSAVLTNESVALVAPGRRLSSQHAGLDLTKGLKNTLDVIVGEVGVDGRHVDPVKGARLLRQLVDNRLSLADVTGPPDLQDEKVGKGGATHTTC